MNLVSRLLTEGFRFCPDKELHLSIKGCACLDYFEADKSVGYIGGGKGAVGRKAPELTPSSYNGVENRHLRGHQ
jgi:hypothetical protein